MPISAPGNVSNERRKRIAILAPYILYKRRKRHAEEAKLIEEIIEEEKRCMRRRKEKQMLMRKKREDDKAQIEAQLSAIKEKANNIEEKLQGLYDEKHELFMKLKCVLITEENEKKSKQLKDSIQAPHHMMSLPQAMQSHTMNPQMTMPDTTRSRMQVGPIPHPRPMQMNHDSGYVGGGHDMSGPLYGPHTAVQSHASRQQYQHHSIDIIPTNRPTQPNRSLYK